MRLDWSGQEPGFLNLSVAVADSPADAPVLLFLTGGPGQGGVSFVAQAERNLPSVLEEYRLVMLDQRGTGAGAIECPELQAAVGGADLLAPPPAAVRACAKAIGPDRRFYTTSDTVADLDHLRKALGVEKWALNGVSYGTYTAERYALAHPSHVRALVLDSVVPHSGVDPFQGASLRRAAYVLRDVCEELACPSDAAKDLATVVRRYGDRDGLLNALTVISVFDPTFTTVVDVPQALHDARLGDTSGLDAIVSEATEAVRQFDSSELSAGLHAATLCGDIDFPWDAQADSVSERRRAVRQALDEFSKRAFWPFDKRTAATNGVIETCIHWPGSTEPPSLPRKLPNVPVLLLVGERDLSTPVEWARKETAVAPDAQLVVVPDEGHSVQGGGPGSGAIEAVTRFLLEGL